MKISSLFFGSLFLFCLPILALAHPGGTDSSGCHTCRTNCADWGLSYGEYHCHNNKGTTQPSYPVSSTYGSGGTGYTTPNPSYAYPSYPTTPSCPSMSSYDSLSDSCKCYSGYVVGKNYLGEEACVSANSVCTDSLGYGARYNSLSNECECRSGYLYDGGECVSEITYCVNRAGLMSQYDSLSKTCECMSGYEFDGSSCVYKRRPSATSYTCPVNSSPSPTDATKCSCDTGYQVNTTQDACVVVPKCDLGFMMKDGQCISHTEDCKIIYGEHVIGTPGPSNNSNCECSSGYQWNITQTSCVKKEVQPSPVPLPLLLPPEIEEPKPDVVKPQETNVEEVTHEDSPMVVPSSSVSNTASSINVKKPIVAQKEHFFQKIWKKLFGWF